MVRGIIPYIGDKYNKPTDRFSGKVEMVPF
jgi:hypothetical protein